MYSIGTLQRSIPKTLLLRILIDGEKGKKNRCTTSNCIVLIVPLTHLGVKLLVIGHTFFGSHSVHEALTLSLGGKRQVRTN